MYAIYNFNDADVPSNIVNSSDSSTISFVYDEEDKLKSKAHPNGVTTTYEYDKMDRLKLLKDVGPTGTLFDRQYGYNNASQINQIVEPSQTRIFGYDNVNRLTSVTGSVSESYVFDEVGNRTSSHRSSSYAYSPFNKIASTQTATYGSDVNGNMTSKGEGSNFWRYTWDYENRMGSASTRKQTVRFRYDALGRRVQRHLVGSKEITKYTYEGDDVLLDNDSGTLTKYLNGPGIDNKLRSTTGSNVSYFLSDHLGSTNELTNATGAVTASNSYDSFGNVPNSAFPTRYQFTGREFDNFTGLQFSRARFYDPNIGRFTSEDPIGFGGGDVNLYAYIRNQPILFRDSRGLFPDGAVLNPNVLAPITAAGSTLVTGIGIAASSPIVVGLGGFVAGYAIGYYPGHALANWKGNPFVNGPLNPFGTPFPMIPPMPPSVTSTNTKGRDYCQPAPRTIPWTRSPSIPWLEPERDSDREGCAEEIAACHVLCAEQAPSDRGRHKGVLGKNYDNCMSGCITARCKKGTGFK